MARLREDPRFRAVQPDAFDTEGEEATTTVHEDPEMDEALELWFDWAFVDFWKNSYYTIQRAIAVEPDAVRGPAVVGDDAESAEIIASLREKLRTQTAQVVELQTQVSGIQGEHVKDKDNLMGEITSLREQLATSTASASDVHTAELETLRADLSDARAQVSASMEETAAHAETKAQLEAARTELEGVKSELGLAKIALTSAKKKVEELEKGGGGDDAPAGKGKKGKKGKGGAGAAAADADSAAAEAKIKQLETDLAAAKASVDEEQAKAADNAKEQEDLLVLLEELTQKRKADKKVMREKGMDVSDDEDEGDDDDDDDE
jgi:hypothetical protein